MALIPPTHGIRATLSNAGVSRVVIGPDTFQTVPIRRDPGHGRTDVAAQCGAGVFDLEAQASGMLPPFEGSPGRHTVWELRMPKAADYRALADVLTAIDYTALPSWDYAQQVIQSLRRSTSGERPYSFRNQLSDQWYDLNNPEQTATPMVVRRRTLGEDYYPPNVDALKIDQVVLYFARKNGSTFEIPVQQLRFTEASSHGTSGGAAISLDGIISTRRGNAGTWMSFVRQRPFGEWELTLPNTEELRRRFATSDIEDILFVITYSGQTQEWPA